MTDTATPGQLLFAKLGIDLDEVPLDQVSDYIAVEYFLTVEDEPPSDATNLEKVRRYLETLHHLCEVQTWEKIKIVLNTVIENNTQIRFSLPLYEHLIYKGLFNTLLAISQIMIETFQNNNTDIDSVKILKARSLSSLGEYKKASKIFENICYLTENKNLYIEAKARLSICQIQSGEYKEGILNIQNCLVRLNEILTNHSENKYIVLKSDIMETIAFYEMSKGNFNSALIWYSEALEVREVNELVHLIISPLAHQGIIYRRVCIPPLHLIIFFISKFQKYPINIKFSKKEFLQENYRTAIDYLEKAMLKAIEIEDEKSMTWIAHHQAWVFLNQGNYGTAEEKCYISIEGYNKLEDRRGIADCYEQLGFIFIAKGNNFIIDAEIYFQKSLAIREDIGSSHGVASCTLDLSLVAWHKIKYLESIKYLIKSFYLYNKLGVLNFTRLARMLTLFCVWTVGNRTWTM